MKTKIDRETVVHEHADGRPHFTVDERGQMHHYERNGAELPPPIPVAEIKVSVERGKRRASPGPAKVASEAYRFGFDQIDWTKAN